jgi:hypothetical protein
MPKSAPSSNARRVRGLKRSVAIVAKYQARIACGDLSPEIEKLFDVASMIELVDCVSTIAQAARWLRPEDLFQERQREIRRARLATRLRQRFGRLSNDVRVSLRFLEDWELDDCEARLAGASSPEQVVIHTAAQQLRIQAFRDARSEASRRRR